MEIIFFLREGDFDGRALPLRGIGTMELRGNFGGSWRRG
jgi:hypothetical protein